MNTNEALLHLYESKWSTLCKVLDERGLAGYEYNPLLLGVKDVEDFDSADIKVMFFGQDMSEGPWYEYNRHTQPLSECMMSIRTFDNKEGSVELNGKRRTKGMGGGMNLFIDRFNGKFKDVKVRYVWNDIIKLGRNLKGNSKKDILLQIESECFDVIKDEINIVKPQVVVFFTGPEAFWEGQLQRKVGINNSNYASFGDWNLRQLALLNLDSSIYPSVKYAFRTYHPSYNFRKHMWEPYEAMIHKVDL